MESLLKGMAISAVLTLLGVVPVDAGEPLADKKSNDMVLEIRAYYIRDGRREEFVRLFEEKTIVPQEASGMKILGQFLSLKDRPDNPGEPPPEDAPYPRYFFDDNYFVWIRAFPSLEVRNRMKYDFYSGPEWRAIQDQVFELLDGEKSLVWVVKPTG